jgi:hypothetical protein
MLERVPVPAWKFFHLLGAAGRDEPPPLRVDRIGLSFAAGVTGLGEPTKFGQLPAKRRTFDRGGMTLVRLLAIVGSGAEAQEDK